MNHQDPEDSIGFHFSIFSDYQHAVALRENARKLNGFKYEAGGVESTAHVGPLFSAQARSLLQALSEDCACNARFENISNEARVCFMSIQVHESPVSSQTV